MSEANAHTERADVTIYFSGVGSGLRFVVHNDGPGVAEQVDVKIESRSGKSSPLVSSEYAEKIPIARLAAGEECVLKAVVTTGTGISFQAQVSWQEPDGSRYHRQANLAL